jgi:hypothetical protein
MIVERQAIREVPEHQTRRKEAASKG